MKFNFSYFAELFAIGATLAYSIAEANGIKPAQIELWSLQLSAKVTK